MAVWKKLCIALLSVGLLGSAAYVGSLLSAAEASTLQFSAQDDSEHYVGNDFSYALSGTRGEEIINISDGTLHGNGRMYEVPFSEGNILHFPQLNQPGFYQGDIIAEALGEDGGSVYELKGMISFMVYGVVYRYEAYEAMIGETILPQTYGAMPEQLKDVYYLYTSDDPTVAQVDEQGYVSALGEGGCQIKMSVYDAQSDDAHLLYETQTTIHVKAAAQHTWNKELALDAEANGYRFVQSQQIMANAQKEQKIGTIALAQSGVYRYEMEEALQDTYAIRDGELYLLKPQPAGTYTISLFIIATDRAQTYELKCTYQAEEAKQSDDSDFVFRYEGKDTASIVRQFQESNNSFQITSNKNLDEVRFSLKDEADSEYLSISEMGSVQVKHVTEAPVTIIARWNQTAYELNLVIEKADQHLTCMMDDVSVSVGDGAFDPLIEGRAGSGRLSARLMGESDAVTLRYNEKGDMSVVPVAPGDALIVFSNDGDMHYRKSNEVTLRVHVLDRQVLSDDWLGNSEWLNLEGEQGENGWFVSDVQMSLKQDSEAKRFQYRDKVFERMVVTDNGISQLPLRFIDAEGAGSTPTRVSLKIDTHAPLITAIDEQEAADSEWKKMVNRLTFQQGFGSGMIATIDATDLLMNEDIRVSGIAQIDYRIYRMDGENQTLIQEGAQAGKDQIKVNIEDTGIHKICAHATDAAGHQGAESCKMMNGDEEVSLRADNSGMILSGSGLLSSDRFTVHEVDAQERAQAAALLGLDAADDALIGYHLEWDGNAETKEPLSARIPISATTMQPLLWYQKQEDGTLSQLEAQKEDDAYVLPLSSLRDIYYVERGSARENEDLRLNQSQLMYSHVTQASNSDTRVALRPLSLMINNADIVLIFSGSVTAACILILLLSGNRNRDAYDE